MFIALLIGAFSLGQAAPSLQDFSVALGAAGFIYDTIDRVSDCVPFVLCNTTCLNAVCNMIYVPYRYNIAVCNMILT